MYEIDPQGDVVLTLRNPNALFAVWDGPEPPPPPAPNEQPTEPDYEETKYADYEDEYAGDFITHSGPSDEPIVIEADKTEPADPPNDHHIQNSDPEPQFRLSSRHLILGSEYFKHTLTGPWKENALVASDGYRSVETEDWDLNALLILMRIIHCRNREVPRTVSLEMLAKIAVLVDYYQCHEAVEVWSDLYIDKLKDSIPTTLNRNLILWILISLVFDKKALFRDVTKTALEHGQGGLPTLGLPIAVVADEIDEQRQEFVHRVFTHMHGLLGLLRDGEAGCSFECSSMMLGALTMQMHSHGILDPQPQPPYSGYGIKSVMELVRGFKSPEWSTPTHRRSYAHGCNLSGLFDEKMNSTVAGLELKDIRR
ncbi:uncharacterized protein F4822DRAFT_49870 [Hypoxylon trugodes]|uniref:uncharacterized protein n=1 Tax=Hypoxylon trugodes TaxID=326681 RepID=UPI00219D308E|nr:uncharacterized protein F4822DRAFT_49870 [Hypoxylon trugodes]KAI1383756.1 hypothetical protein F4822DRAFT_49870 [Hypoxylon trugodes]